MSDQNGKEFCGRDAFKSDAAFRRHWFSDESRYVVPPANILRVLVSKIGRCWYVSEERIEPVSGALWIHVDGSSRSASNCYEAFRIAERVWRERVDQAAP